jgi:hypothetical protein
MTHGSVLDERGDRMFDEEPRALWTEGTSPRSRRRTGTAEPRVSVTVFDRESLSVVDIAGIAELVEDREKTLPRRLSHGYLGEDPLPAPAELRRLIVRVVPHEVTGFPL